MALEEKIVDWSTSRPAWQRDILRRVATGEMLTDADYDRLVDNILTSKPAQPIPFGLEHLVQSSPQDFPVSLESIANPDHVNALASKEPLTFGARGMTIVYGDNGSGKSGYARLLKRVSRARHHEEVLTDVFRDTALASPTARLSVRIGPNSASFNWPSAATPDLLRMRFYDGACGLAYITSESDFPFRPSALFVMDGLINACVAIRARIDTRLATNARSANPLPVVEPDLATTSAGHFLHELSGQTSIDTLDAFVKTFRESKETIEDLQVQEARLRSADISRERQALGRQREKVELLNAHLERISHGLKQSTLSAIEDRRSNVDTLDEAVRLLARSFESEPLRGVGSAAWKALWESAQRYSEAHAYPARPFPAIDHDDRCVFCQQMLQPDGRDRLARFNAFIKEDTQVRLREAQRAFENDVITLSGYVAIPEAIAVLLRDLDSSHQEVVQDVRSVIQRYETLGQLCAAGLQAHKALPASDIDAGPVIARLSDASRQLQAAVTALDDPTELSRRLAAVTSKRRQLELLSSIACSRDSIAAEIGRLREREALEAAKNAAATGPITNKILELSEESITEVIRDTFTRETDRLHLERVTLTMTRGEKGALLHQPKLVGIRQQVALPRVFSEGERTALGLSAFFTEAQLDSSRSTIIFDDPVNSLDHMRRALVASRLASFAETRQVVVFTHDVAFVVDLKREAAGRAVPVTERSVARSRAEERKPGGCSMRHPWKAKDVPERFEELRRELARIKKESTNWDGNTYDDAVAMWAGNLSETWERIFSQEIVGQILAEGGLEVRPLMVKILTRFSPTDENEFSASYSRVSQWARRHDKSTRVNYVSPEIQELERELTTVDQWFKRVRAYKN